jgi:hypothetical protein
MFTQEFIKLKNKKHTKDYDEDEEFKEYRNRRRTRFRNDDKEFRNVNEDNEIIEEYDKNQVENIPLILSPEPKKR